MKYKSKWEHDYDGSGLLIRHTHGYDGVFDILNEKYPDYVKQISEGLKMKPANMPIFGLNFQLIMLSNNRAKYVVFLSLPKDSPALELEKGYHLFETKGPLSKVVEAKSALSNKLRLMCLGLI